jgi:hypothetical protein
MEIKVNYVGMTKQSDIAFILVPCGGERLSPLGASAAIRPRIIADKNI